MNYHKNMSLYSAFLGLMRSFVVLKFCFLVCGSIEFVGSRYNLINLLKHILTFLQVNELCQKIPVSNLPRNCLFLKIVYFGLTKENNCLLRGHPIKLERYFGVKK